MDDQRDERSRSVPFALRVAFQVPSHIDWRDATHIKAFVFDYLFAVQEALLDDLEVAARDIEDVSASAVAADGAVVPNSEHGVVSVLRAVTESREITKYYKAIIDAIDRHPNSFADEVAVLRAKQLERVAESKARWNL